MVKLTSQTDIDDFLLGLELMSANGGGNPEDERAHLYQDLQEGLEIGWSDLDLVLDADGLICTVLYTGAPTEDMRADDPAAADIAQGKTVTRPLVEAVRALEAHLGTKIVGLVSGELGGINGGAVLDAATRLGIPLIDGDYSGRAIPELMAIAPSVADLPILPGAFVDHYGNRLVIEEAASTGFAERIGKYLAAASFGMIGWALAALPPKTVGDIYVKGSLSRTMQLGRSVREARTAGQDPVEAAARAMGGAVFFEGTLVKREWQNTGYMEGTHELEGAGAYEGHRLKIYFRNEHHVSWLDGVPFVCSPDLIQACHAGTGEPARVETMSEGDRLSVIGCRRPDHYSSERALSVVGPRHYGFDIDYTPIEQLDLSQARRDASLAGSGAEDL